MTVFTVSTSIPVKGVAKDEAVVGARAPVSREGYTGAARVTESPARGTLGYCVAGFTNPTGRGPSTVSREGYTEDAQVLTTGGWLKDLAFGGGLSTFRPPSQYCLPFLPFFP